MKRESPLAQTERAVLAVLLNDAHAVFAVQEVLPSGEEFSTPALGRVYDAVLTLTKAGTVSNVHTVATHLNASLEELNAVAAGFTTKLSREVVYLAETVAREAARRRVIAALDEARSMAATPCEDVTGMAFTAMQMISGASAASRSERDPLVAEVGKRLDTELETRERLGVLGYSTGSEWLDDKTGGLRPANVLVVSAPYKQRKTTLAAWLAVNACRRGAGVSYFALEGDQIGCYARMIAMLATDRLAKWKMTEEMLLSETFIRRGFRSEAQQSALAEARKELDAFRLRIYDGRDRIGSAAEVRAKLRRDAFLYGVDVFVVDYLQLLGEGRLFDRVEDTTRQLQRAAVEDGLCAVILAQLNESAIWAMHSGDGKDNYSPGVKGGGDPAAAADCLFRTFYNQDDDPSALLIELKLARNARPGRKWFTINEQSGWILGESNRAVKESAK